MINATQRFGPDEGDRCARSVALPQPAGTLHGPLANYSVVVAFDGGTTLRVAP